MTDYVGDSSYYAGGIVERIITAETKINLPQHNVMLPLITNAPMESGDSWTIPVWNFTTELGATAMAQITDYDTGATKAEPESAKVNTACALYGMYLRLFDEAQDSSVEDINVRLGQAAAAAAGAKIDVLTGDLLSAFSNTAGSSSIAMTVDNLFDAASQVHANGGMGQLQGVFHPYQLEGENGLSNDLVTTTSMQGNSAQSQAMLNGFFMPVGGVNLFSNRNAKTATTSHYGGVFTRDAIGFGWVNPLVRFELDRVPKIAATDLVVRIFGSAKEIVDVYGVTLRTKTS